MTWTWTVSRKLGLLFLLFILAVFLGTWAGFRGITDLAEKMDVLLGTSWARVQATARITREVGAQVRSLQQLLNSSHEEEIREPILAELRKSDQRLLEVRTTISELGSKNEVYEDELEAFLEARKLLVESHEAFRNRHKHLLERFETFEGFMQLLEEYEAAQSLADEESGSETSFGGFDIGPLDAAMTESGAVDVHLALLQWFYRYQKVVSRQQSSPDEGNLEDEKERLDFVLGVLSQKSSLLKGVSFFKSSPQDPRFADQGSYIEILERFEKSHKENYLAAIATFETYRATLASYDRAAKRVMEALEVYRDRLDQDIGQEKILVEQSSAKAKNILLISLFVVIVLAAGAFAYILFFISQPLQEVTRAMVAFANGQTDVEPPSIHGDDEMGQLGESLRRLLEGVRNRESKIRDSALILGEEAGNVSSASSEQSNLVREQATAIRETATAATELRSMTSKAKEVAEAVHQMAEGTLQDSQEGLSANEDAKKGVFRLSGRINEISDTVSSLSRKMEQIGEILAAVNELAEQSKLLALNAAIEAARAGEHGKGFGVVSLEVRNLAQQSQDATKQIRTIIREISSTMAPAIAAAEEGQLDAERGREAIERTEQVITRLTQGLSESRQSAERILKSVNQQDIGIEQISKAIDNIDLALSRSVETTERTRAVSERLTAAEEALRRLLTASPSSRSSPS